MTKKTKGSTGYEISSNKDDGSGETVGDSIVSLVNSTVEKSFPKKLYL